MLRASFLKTIQNYFIILFSKLILSEVEGTTLAFGTSFSDSVVSKPKERPYSEKTDILNTNFDILTKTYELTLATHNPTRMFKNFSHRTFKKIILASRTLAHLQNLTSRHTIQVLQKSQFSNPHSTVEKIFEKNKSN